MMETKTMKLLEAMDVMCDMLDSHINTQDLKTCIWNAMIDESDWQEKLELKDCRRSKDTAHP